MTNCAKVPLLQEELVIHVNRSLLPQCNDDARVMAAIDCGSELTKIVFVTDSDDADIQQLHFALFQNEHLDDALEFLSTKLDKQRKLGINESAKKQLRVTGVGIGLHGGKIREKLNVDLEYVDEPASHCTGLHFLLKHCPRQEEFFHPMPTIDESEFSSIQHGETFKRFLDSAKESALADPGPGGHFPCLLIVYGSTTKVFQVNEDGSFAAMQTLNLAGKSFLGLNQLLIGTRDYVEIMQLASAGKRGNVDSQVRDLMGEDSPPGDSPYGRLPPSLPFFGFGKAVDFDLSLEDARREDVAQSLLSSFSASIVHQVTHGASVDKIRNIFYGGNFLLHEFARAEIIRTSKVFFAIDAMNVQFLKISHLAALGALLRE